jgi:hypothetical protein
MTNLEAIDIEYLTSDQFSRLVGLSTSTLAKARMAGGGPPFCKVGRSVRYERAAGLAWMAAHIRRSTSEVQVNEKHRRNTQRASTAVKE